MLTLTIGESVPNLTLTMTSGKTLHLSDFKDKAHVVLYFYPKDNTPGCTTEGQDFRDSYPDFKAAHTEIIGISRDSIKSHENFKAKQSFPFELASDSDESICRLFEVIKLKNRYGKSVQGIERSTFVIDKQGILCYEWRNVSVKGHVAEVLRTVRSLS